MSRRQIASGAVSAILAFAVGGCELALGELPTPLEDLPAVTSAATGGAGGTVGAGATGGAAGTGMSGGSGGATMTGGAAGTGMSGGSGGAAMTGGAAGTGGSGGSGGQGGCCDCDGDKQLAMGLCGGDDCDDQDPKTYKDEPIYYDVPNAHDFDWDCSGMADPNPALNVAVDCSKLLGLDCNTDIGFLGMTVPACGQTGKWGTCLKKLGACVEQVIETSKKMTCK